MRDIPSRLRAFGPRGLAPQQIAFLFFIAVLAWAPFPLGSNRPWAWSLLVCLIAGCWICWWAVTWTRPNEHWRILRHFKFPALFAGLALLWAWAQAAPFLPQSMWHPVWAIAAKALGHPVQGYVSLNPWSTATEATKLCAYVAAAILSLAMTQRANRARLLVDMVIAIGSFYSLYAALLRAAGWTQLQIFYPVQPVGKLISGPFVLHNSFATFVGLATLCAMGRLFQSAGGLVVAGRGPRVFLVSLLDFLSGRGLWLLLAVIVNFSMLVASASRAGFAATIGGLLAMGLLSVVSLKRRSHRRIALWSSLGVGLLLLLLMAGNGRTLLFRLETRETGITRIIMWQAGQRMIEDAPLLGLGLGTYEDAYPLYADHAEPFIVDKAHNDYIEFAAGLGLPAACCWWLAMLLLAGRCLKGVYERRRDGLFPLLAVGASVLVGLHSIMDFSLQMPAVSLLYAAILGMGLAQSFSTASRRKIWRRAGLEAPPSDGAAKVLEQRLRQHEQSDP